MASLLLPVDLTMSNGSCIHMSVQKHLHECLLHDVDLSLLAGCCCCSLTYHCALIPPV